MTVLADSWSIGVLIGVPVTIVLVLISLVAIVVGYADRKSRGYDWPIWIGSGVILLVLTLAIAAWGFYPYNAQYHKWHETSGRVTEISSRFLGNDKSTTQKFVVRFENGDERGCQDTRCALVKVGDTLTLTCKRQWQFAGRDGWDCNYIEDVRA